MQTNSGQPDELAGYLAWSSLLLGLVGLLVTLVRLIWNIVPVPIASYSFFAASFVWFVVGNIEIERRLRRDYSLGMPATSTLLGEATRGLPPPWPHLIMLVLSFCVLVFLGLSLTTEHIVQEGSHYIVRNHPEQVRTAGHAEVADNDYRIAFTSMCTAALLVYGVVLLTIHQRTYGKPYSAR